MTNAKRHSNKRPAPQKPQSATPRPRQADDDRYQRTGMTCSKNADSCMCYQHLNHRLRFYDHNSSFHAMPKESA